MRMAFSGGLSDPSEVASGLRKVPGPPTETPDDRAMIELEGNSPDKLIPGKALMFASANEPCQIILKKAEAHLGSG